MTNEELFHKIFIDEIESNDAEYVLDTFRFHRNTRTDVVDRIKRMSDTQHPSPYTKHQTTKFQYLISLHKIV